MKHDFSFSILKLHKLENQSMQFDLIKLIAPSTVYCTFKPIQ